MILNNGRYEVDTAQSDFVGKAKCVTQGNMYDFETTKVFTAYRSRRSGRGFIVLGYKDPILGIFTTKHVLVDVYPNEQAFSTGRLKYRIVLESEKQVPQPPEKV